MRALLLIALLVLGGCDAQREYSVNGSNMKPLTEDLPPELKDCVKVVFGRKNGAYESVWRCPNSTTTTQHGKFSSTVVIEGSAPK